MSAAKDPLYRVCPDLPLTPAEMHRAEAVAVEENPANRAPVGAPALRAGALTAKLWRPGRVLRVAFLDGTLNQRAAVRRHARTWTQHCNLKFRFVRPGDGEIRVSFAQYGVSWSYVGTDALLRTDGPTMNFGWFDDSTPDREYSRTVLHEFGHALGLFHEHQNPEGGIRWRERETSDYYRRTMRWSDEEVRRNVLDRVKANQSQYTKCDRRSIMIYPIPRELTRDGVEIGVNHVLSATDKRFIRRVYPHTRHG
jgi:hypothetical protein